MSQNSQSPTSASSIYAAYSGNTYLFGGNAPYVEEMYENYLANPGSVPDTWREYFDALQHVPAVSQQRFAVLPLSSVVVGVRVGRAVESLARQLHPDRFA